MAETDQAWRLLVCPKTQAALVYCGDGLVSSDPQWRLIQHVVGVFLISGQCCNDRYS